MIYETQLNLNSNKPLIGKYDYRRLIAICFNYLCNSSTFPLWLNWLSYALP